MDFLGQSKLIKEMCVKYFKRAIDKGGPFTGYKVFRKIPGVSKLRGMMFTLLGGYEFGRTYIETLEFLPETRYRAGFHVFKTIDGARKHVLNPGEVIVEVECKDFVGTGIYGDKETGIFRKMKLLNYV